MQSLHDLLAFTSRCVFNQVGNLSGLESPNATERSTNELGSAVTDQRLKGLPIFSVAHTRLTERCKKPRRSTARIERTENPAIGGLFKIHVPRPNELCIVNIDQSMPKDVFSKQNFTTTALETSKIYFGLDASGRWSTSRWVGVIRSIERRERPDYSRLGDH